LKSPLRPLYDWTLHQAEKPYVGWVLFLLAVVEPCVFPTPPDILMLPAVLARRDKAYTYAAICTLGSLTGALIGYGIGALAMATIGNRIVNIYDLHDALQHSRAGFHEWGTLLIIAKASVPFIPVPFFLVVIASGVFHFSLLKLIGAVAAVRATRFSLEAWLLRRFGEPIRYFIEHHLNWIVVVGMTLLIAWVVMAHKNM
jgi:membrane protein YqaA with SNARE-associated domain